MTTEEILRVRMFNLWLTRRCPDVVLLAREMLGLHSWFYRNVRYSAIIRGADISRWKTRLTKTWLYRGTLHGVDPDDLPLLLALHQGETWFERQYGRAFADNATEEVVRCLEDGIYSRQEMRQIFSDTYDRRMIDDLFSPWGGIFVGLARRGIVAFRDMTSRDFDLIAVDDIPSFDDAFPEALRRYFAAYGPSTTADAAWFMGLSADHFKAADLSAFNSFELDGKRFYYTDEPEKLPDIPKVQILAGFDPLIVSYSDRGAVLPDEYKRAVILTSGICMPTVAVDGRIAGLWSIKKRDPVVEFFTSQPKRIRDKAAEQVERIIRAPEN
ncbi:MAG: winged helix DNA-binding domain-containing protein [Oscillospiraceae bacterium]|jgi:hypothetical protein|nr:winged helix DNA-binding domain-containing protein [Oscillospiraceae bacterium]